MPQPSVQDFDTTTSVARKKTGVTQFFFLWTIVIGAIGSYFYWQKCSTEVPLVRTTQAEPSRDLEEMNRPESSADEAQLKQ